MVEKGIVTVQVLLFAPVHCQRKEKSPESGDMILFMFVNIVLVVTGNLFIIVVKTRRNR